MTKPRVVLDTNVIVSAFRSRQGASHQLLLALERGRYSICLSVPLVLECESAAKRSARQLGVSYGVIDEVLDFLCKVGERRLVHFLWRPSLRDPDDEMVLEAAVAAGVHAIVTHNLKDFVAAGKFGIGVATPQDFLRDLGKKR